MSRVIKGQYKLNSLPSESKLSSGTCCVLDGKSLLLSVLMFWVLVFGYAQMAWGQSQAPALSLIDEQAIEEIRDWLKAPVVEMSIQAQNKKYDGVDQSAIDALDKQWRAERKLADQPLIAATLSSPLSNYVTQIQAASGGLFTEIFVMDRYGLNVGQSSITSDFWQGDEGKFQKTFPKGVNTVFVDEAEFNEESKTWRAQVNMTVANSKGEAIGAVTVEYNLTELARRRGVL